MTTRQLIVATLIGASSAAFAAPVAYVTVDHSSAALIDAAAVKAVWQEQLSEKFTKRLARVSPPSRWAFISQVEGGFNEAKICVVTARVAFAPRSGKTVVFTPAKMATAFDALPNATSAQCAELAKAKLREAIAAVASSLITP
jgi:hypothetical protein